MLTEGKHLIGTAVHVTAYDDSTLRCFTELALSVVEGFSITSIYIAMTL